MSRWTRRRCCVRATSRWSCGGSRAWCRAAWPTNTYWLGRYVERAENIARILRSMAPRVSHAEEPELGSLILLHSTLGTRHSKLPKSRRTVLTYAHFEKELRSMLTDAKRPDSLASTLHEVARIGGSVRERLSTDMMLLIGQLRNAMEIDPKDPDPDYTEKLTDCLELLSSFSGMERENVNRGSGWLFMSLGRRLERAVYMTRHMRIITRPLALSNWSYLEALLEVADSSVTYRTRYYTTLQPLAVLDVLLADETNPRSLDFQLEHIAELYAKLPRHGEEDLAAMEDAVGRLRAIDLQAMRYPTPEKRVEDRARKGQNDLRPLDRFLQELEGLLPSWSNNLSTRYFSHARTLPSTMGQ